jgi:DNA-binding NtrC family response regulator
MRILVINEERTVADSLAEVLHLNGHHVLPLYDAIEAVEHAEHMAFDVALITIRPQHSIFHLGNSLQTMMPRCKLIFVVSSDMLWFWQGLVERFGFLPASFQTDDLLRKIEAITYLRSLQPTEAIFSDSPEQL